MCTAHRQPLAVARPAEATGKSNSSGDTILDTNNCADHRASSEAGCPSDAQETSFLLGVPKIHNREISGFQGAKMTVSGVLHRAATALSDLLLYRNSFLRGRITLRSGGGSKNA